MHTEDLTVWFPKFVGFMKCFRSSKTCFKDINAYLLIVCEGIIAFSFVLLIIEKQTLFLLFGILFTFFV